MNALLLTLALFISPSSHAGVSLSGQVVKAPATVKALSEQGVVETYNVTGVLNTADVSDDSLNLTDNGVMAMCGDYYGQLAEDFTVVVKDAGGAEHSVTVKAASKDRKVSVFGMCQGQSRDLDQLQLAILKGDAPEIH